MSEAIEVLNALGDDVVALDRGEKALDKAIEELNTAEEAWDELWDQVAESLEGEYTESGRKSAPSEHTIRSTCRRQHRAAYTRLQRARREKERVEEKLRSRRSAMNGRQSVLNALRDELRATA